MLELVRESDFREYFDPFTGAGYGSDRFAWTAARSSTSSSVDAMPP
jgi:hypothetical protein